MAAETALAYYVKCLAYIASRKTVKWLSTSAALTFSSNYRGAYLLYVIVISRFLQRPQKRSRGNQFIHRRLSKTKIDRQRVKFRESSRQTVRRLWWMVFGVETEREVGRSGQIRIGFVEDQCVQFGVKEVWRDSKGWGFGKFLGWIRYVLWLYWL